MRRLATLGLALAAAAVAWGLRSEPSARAVASVQVVGEYRLRLKGAGWLRGKSEPYRAERIAGGATLIVARATADANDGRLHVEIRLDAPLAGGLLDLATPEPAFVGEGALVGDSLAVIDTGGPTYVNALTLRFVKQGGRVEGNWLSAYPAADAGQSAASAASVEFAGRRHRGQSATVR